MAIGFQVGGSTTYFPGVYSTIQVEGSLANVVPSPRNVLIIGESTEGAPFSDVDMRVNYFTDLQSVQAIYGSGSVVDAAAQLFSNQPNRVFTGTVGRVYIAKTNQSARASKAISSPSMFGTLYAAKYGESGNYIRSQILNAQSEVKPSVAFTWVPSVEPVGLSVSVNGNKAADGVAMDIEDMAGSKAALASALTGKVTVVGAFVETIAIADTLTVAVNGSEITITCNNPFANIPAVGATLVIPPASAIKGSANKNIGSYIVSDATETTIVAQKVISINAAGDAEIAYIAPEAVTPAVAVAGDQTLYAEAEFIVFSKMSLTSVVASKAGQGGSLEFGEEDQAIVGSGTFIQWSEFEPIVTQETSGVAQASVAVSGSDITITLVDGAFSSVPAVGDVMFVPPGSIIAGTGNANVGLFVVKSASATAIVLNKANGLTGAVVAAVPMAGNPEFIKWCPSLISNSLAAKTHISSSERKVKLVAANTQTGSVFPSSSIGGEAVLNISYYNASATSAKVSIDNARRMVFTFVGGLDSVTVYLNKYATLKELVDYINTLTGFSAAVANVKWNAYPTSILDAIQDVEILSLGSVQSAAVGRIKADFWAWSSFISGANSIVSFEKGNILYAAGLPSAEAYAGYLSGGALGGTSNENIADALDAGLLLPVRQVLPCFSRDSRYDVEEGMTDPASTYTIDSINLAVSGHCATASSDINRHRRIGLLSFHGSFADSKIAAAAINFSRCSMMFQQVRATDSNGNVKWFLPWMGQACLCAGRSQAVLGTSMLRKNFRIADARHIGNLPVSSTTWVQDFNAEDSQGQVTEAIQAGLLVLGPVPGSGLKIISPDLTTQSGVNSPTGWFYERTNVIFDIDEVFETAMITLENYIGERTNDISPAAAASAVDSIIGQFVRAGSLIAAQPSTVQDLGNGYKLTVRVRPPECLEFMHITGIVSRNV